MRLHLTCLEPNGFAWKSLLFFILALVAHPRPCRCEEVTGPFTLKSSIDYALKHSTQILSSTEEVAAAQANKRKQFTEFLPKFSANYTYTRSDKEQEIAAGIVISPQDLFTFTATVEQPIFSGFQKTSEYQISQLGLDIARYLKQQTRNDLIYMVKGAYFEILQREKLAKVARQAVTQLAAHARVASNYYEVGMIPRNDVLKAEVELANANQDLVVANNNVEVSKSSFNRLLRRPVDSPLAIEDVMAYEPFTLAYEKAVETALSQRPEVHIANLQMEMAEQEVRRIKHGYYPSLDFQANYYKRGDDPHIDGGKGIFDREEWNVMATASWNFWEWGKTRYGVKEKLHHLARVRLSRIEIEDSIRHQVKEAYLSVKEAEKNILPAKKAVVQAQENFRISEERYKEQVATSTEVLDAQTLLTKTQTNYFNALSAFNISRAALDRAMGINVVK